MGTKIEWAELSWNPIRARYGDKIGWHCTPVSDGCKYCYAAMMNKSARFWGTGLPYGKTTKAELFIDEKALDKPFHWRKPRRIFPCSMSDLFHPDVPSEWIHDIYDVMRGCPQHQFIVLTKRPERLVKVLYDEPPFYFGGGDYCSNILHLASCENQETYDERMPHMLDLWHASAGGFKVGFSLEPLLAPIDLHLTKSYRKTPIKNATSWIIVGCETSAKRRYTDWSWVKEIILNCYHLKIPVFVKKLYDGKKQISMPMLFGQVWDQFVPMPEVK